MVRTYVLLLPGQAKILNEFYLSVEGKIEFDFSIEMVGFLSFQLATFHFTTQTIHHLCRA